MSETGRTEVCGGCVSGNCSIHGSRPAGPPPIPPVAPVYVQTNHLVHAILSAATCGMWLMVWPLVALANNQTNASRRSRYQEALNHYQQAVWMREQHSSY